MATITNTLQLAGFTQGGNPATGSGLLGSKTIYLWSDGSITFTNPAGQMKKMEDHPPFNTLFAQLVKGAGGVSTTQVFHQH